MLNTHRHPDMTTHLGIEFTEVGENWLAAKMPVDERTRQPLGLLHGGASVALAETLGSLAGYLMLPEGKACVGLEINANHIRSVRQGYVFGKAVPLHIGKTTHVWEIKIHDQEQRLVCVSRLTLAVIDL
ncbi:MAG: hotdog fold thioesterase [Cytophagales bacterium]|nr:hotdog fold thioesterase [Bernardetiaceae bacterium]MDW8210236.1 hotdog fold thioesterase [Cytophagales bacterium]